MPATDSYRMLARRISALITRPTRRATGPMKITTIRPIRPAAASVIQASVVLITNRNGRITIRLNMSRKGLISLPVMKSRTL